MSQVDKWLEFGWTPEMIAEELTASIWDMPAIETREELKAAFMRFLSDDPPHVALSITGVRPEPF